MNTILYTFIILLIFLPGIIKAQTQLFQDKNFTLNNDQSGATKTYEARDYIKLTNGFRFSSSDGNKFNAKLNENLLFDVDYVAPTDPTTYNIDQNLPVGTIPGQFDVSPTGAANYTIPIDVAPGTASMQPNLSVVYNSQSGNGILGLGWNISGLSTITRVPASDYFDGQIGSINFNNTDKFLFDGQRLLRKTGSYGDAGSTYIKENNDFSTITFLGNNDGFEVVSKDGITFEFGKNPLQNSKLLPENQSTPTPVSWFIDKITDRLGNFMEYYYESSNGEIVIKEIKYTGNTNANSPTYNSIKFFYETRTTDDNKFYIGGYVLNSTKLLNKIKIESSGTIIKSYDFYYADDFYSKFTNVSL